MSRPAHAAPQPAVVKGYDARIEPLVALGVQIGEELGFGDGEQSAAADALRGEIRAGRVAHVGLDDDDMDDDQATIALPSMAVDDGSIAVDGTTAPR